MSQRIQRHIAQLEGKSLNNVPPYFHLLYGLRDRFLHRKHSIDTKTKINNKGQFVTVINHGQKNRQDEPSPTYKSAKTYGKQG
ncbi:hypothetical protein SLS63_002794 [Diaporthe eres]|uniref:Uncharacterized protein n=1 Tax=Diaporthe eres TaxID=83184 RepID=A0ABR1PJ55_DIAER